MASDTAAQPTSTAAPSATGAVGSATPTMQGRQRAVVAYLLTFVTGIIVYVSTSAEDRFVRWHALQAMLLGAVALVMHGVLNIVSIMILFLVGPLPVFQKGAWSAALSLGMVAWPVAYVFVVIAAMGASRGERTRIPLVAGWADRFA